MSGAQGKTQIAHGIARYWRDSAAGMKEAGSGGLGEIPFYLAIRACLPRRGHSGKRAACVCATPTQKSPALAGRRAIKGIRGSGDQG